MPAEGPVEDDPVWGACTGRGEGGGGEIGHMKMDINNV